MKVDLSAEAQRDLETIGNYIARDDPGRAVTFLRELRAKCLDPADHPRRFPFVSRYEAWGIRHRVYRSYLIFYRVDPDRRRRSPVSRGSREA